VAEHPIEVRRHHSIIHMMFVCPQAYTCRMRTTLTLDDDLAMMLKREAESSRRPFRDVVNDAIRRGLVASASARPVIEVPVFDLGSQIDENPWDLLAREDAARLRELTGPPHPNNAVPDSTP